MRSASQKSPIVPCSISPLRRGVALPTWVLVSLLMLLCGAGLLSIVEGKENNSGNLKAADLFNLTNVWTLHLTFTPEQWEAMEPKGGGFGPFGGGRGGAAGRGGGRGGAGFGPGMFLAPAFLGQGDQNKDTKLSELEFHALSEKWFGDWDQDKKGTLKEEQVRAGLNSSLGPPPGGRLPGAGAPGGRMPGMSLQGAEGRRNGLSSAAGIEFKYVHADLEFDGKPFKDVGVRYKGNGTFMQSRGSLKRSLKIHLNEYAKGQKLAGLSTLNLHNNVTDASWMNEVLSHRLFREAGVPAPRTAYARVYLTVSGKYDRQYLGLYSLVENIDSNFAQEAFGSKKGALFKPVTRNPFEDLGSDWSQYQQTYDPKTSLTAEQKQRVIQFCQLVTRADDAEFAAKLGDYLDLDEFARFMAVTTWVCTLDSILGIGQNYVVYLDPRTQKFQFMPWDLDHSFGQFGMVGGQEQREQLSIHKPWQGEIRLLERVFKVEAFKKVYLTRMNEFSTTIFQPERLQKQVDEIAAAIQPAVKEESSEKLERFEKVVAGEAVAPAFFGGGFGGPRRGGAGAGEGPRFGPPGGFGQAPKPIKSFVTARARSVGDQLTGKSEGQMIERFGPGGFGGRGGAGARGGSGGPGDFGPGTFLGPAIMAALDADKNGELTKAEFTAGFDNWFRKWNSDQSGSLTDEQLRAGIDADLSLFRGGPGGPGFGPRGGRPVGE